MLGLGRGGRRAYSDRRIASRFIWAVVAVAVGRAPGRTPGSRFSKRRWRSPTTADFSVLGATAWRTTVARFASLDARRHGWPQPHAHSSGMLVTG